MSLLVTIVVVSCFGAALAVAGRALYDSWTADAPPPDPAVLDTTADQLRATLGAADQDSLDGTVLEVPGPHPVTVHLHRRGGRPSASIIAPVHGPSDLRLVPEDALRFRDPLVDDPAFDHALHLRGPADWLSAALDQTARQDLLFLNSQGLLSVDDDLLALQTVGLRPEQVVHTVQRIQGVAAALSLRSSDVPAQLLARSETEPPGPRALAAVRLLAFHAGTLEARTLAQRLEPRPTDVLELLDGSIDHHLDRFARAALEHRSADLLLPPLLDHDHPDIALAAVASLRRLGTGACIPALEAAARGPLKKPALAAIAAIRDRAGPNAAGALTVLDDADAGAVSLTAQQRGGLAIKGKG